VLYEGMPAGLRAALHVQAARMLAGGGAAPERVAAQLVSAGLNSGVLGLGQDGSSLELERGHPGQEAGVPVDDWVVAWLADAAPVLIYRSPQVAEELLRAVLGQLSAGDRRRAGLEASLVAALFRLERYEETARAGVRLLAGETDPQRVADTYWLVVYATLRIGRVEEARTLVAQALARPGLSESRKPRLRALQAMTLGPIGEYDRVEAIARQALAGAEETADRFAAGYALHALSAISFYRRDPIARIEYINRALSMVEMDPQAIDLRLLLLANKTFHLSNMDLQAEAIAAARQALALAERAGTPRVQQVRYGLAQLHFDLGEWDDALAELEQASAVAGAADKRLEIYGMLALIAAYRGERETAARHLRAVDDVDLSVAPPSALFTLLLAKSLAAEQDGRLADAIAVLAEWFEPGMAERMPGVYYLATPLARVALANGDRETASVAARVAEAEAAHQPLPLRTAMANHCRGLAAGDPALILSAADYFRAAGRVFHQAQALEDAAALEAERGQLTAAQEHLAAAVGGYAGLGAAWNIEQAGTRLQSYGVRPSRSAFRARPTAGWEALTPTEVKVAYLVADGRSNPDVAAALFLSRNTVQTHVSHILAKLGARSRAEIIREAVRHPAKRQAATA
jgi:DNA-binding CsgD family transcriptional regulator/tetratricopeptide (TPR) repeat protein